MYPANKIFGVAIVTSSIFNMAIPGAMSMGPAAVVILKVAQGFVEVSEDTFLCELFMLAVSHNRQY